jgi:D-proline reductase (dithiol) PrdB
MARLEDIPLPTRTAVANIECPVFTTTPFVTGRPLSQRKVAIVSSAALVQRGEAPFPFGSTEARFLPASLPPGDLLMSHVSINYDRHGFERDVNVAFPLERLRALAAEGLIGGLAETNYTVMGSSDPVGMVAAADQISGQLKQENVDAVLLTPV